MDTQGIKSIWPDWEVVRRIGTGSYGTVYEIQRDMFGHVEMAAVKVISIPRNESDIDELRTDGYDQKSITTRFQDYMQTVVREYSMMAEMKGCANIVYCDDVKYIQHDDGMGWDIFIKMELLTPLTKMLDGAVTEAQAAKLGADISNALAFCEQHNVLHRDIKPQNIFVAADGTYKLGDFGVAKTVEKTLSGTVAGTYNYMAPEVFGNRPYGAKADIYSLGLVLYWLLNERRLPFLPLPPELPTAAMEEAARARRLRGEPIPVPKNGSPELKRLVLTACAYDPEMRFPSAEEMHRRFVACGGAPEQTPVTPIVPVPGGDGTMYGPRSRGAANGANPPTYGANPPSYGTTPPAYGANPPAYGANPPAYGSNQPAYGAEPTPVYRPTYPPTSPAGRETRAAYAPAGQGGPPPQGQKRAPRRGVWIIVAVAVLAICAAAFLLLRDKLFPPKEEKEKVELLSFQYTAVNTGRQHNALVLYDQPGMTVETNVYGVEIAVDAEGRIVATRNYGSEDRLTVPEGGFVLSGHRAWDDTGTAATGGALWIEKAIYMEEHGGECEVELDRESSAVRVLGWEGTPAIEYRRLTVSYMLDGYSPADSTACGMFDIYINGAFEGKDSMSYSRPWPVGTEYEIKNIRAVPGAEYLGTAMNSNLSGVINDNTVVLSFRKVETTDLPIEFTAFGGNLTDYKKVPFVSASASSQTNDAKTVFYASLAVDGDLATAWQEGADKDGIGETLTAFFGGAREVSLLSIRPGVASKFSPNSRPKVLKFDFSDGRSATYAFPDENRTFYLQLSSPVTTEYIKVTILEAYTGSRYTDTGITELACYRLPAEGETPDAGIPGNSRYVGHIARADLNGLCIIQCGAFHTAQEAENYVDVVIEKENSLGCSNDVFITQTKNWYLVCVGPYEDYWTANHEGLLLNTTYPEENPTVVDRF